MAWGSLVQSSILTVDANYEFLTNSGDNDAFIIELAQGESGTLVLHVDVAGTPTDDLEVQVVGGPRISTGNALDGATAGDDLELDTAADGFSTDDDMNGLHIIMTSGDEQGEGRLIIDSVAADDGVNLSHALSGTPSAAETYDLYAFGKIYEFTLPLATAAEDEPNTKRLSLSWLQGHYIGVKTRASGSTDAHRVRAFFEPDNALA